MEKFKKILSISLLALFSYGFIINPASAILENTKKEKQEQPSKASVLESVNFDWWQNLNDSYLEGYISKALENNHDIKTAALKIEQAKINVTAVRANQLPQFSVGAAPFLTKFPTETKTNGSFAFPLQASYELDLFGKNWDKTKSAKKILQGVEYETQTANIAVVSLVGTTYYNIVKLDKVIELQEKLTKDRKEIYDLMKISNKEGLVSTQDLIASEKSYILSQNDLLDYKKTRQNALNALAVLIGDSANNTKEYRRISFDSLTNSVSIPNEISSEVIINRPDYKSLERQLEASGIDIRVAKKEFLPTINILGLLSFVTASNMGGKMNWDNALSLLGGSANLPIFTGFKRVANLKMNKNKYAQLLEQYQKTNLIAIQEINDSLYNLKADKEKLDNNIKALNIQKKDYTYSKSKFDKGVISKLDLLQQKEALLYTQQLETLSKMELYIDKISLYKATGARI